MFIPSNSLRSGAWAAIAFAALLFGGCADYLNHRDRVTLAAGDDVQWNKAVHTIDPWPPGVVDTDIPASGKRTERVIKGYEDPAAAVQPTNVTVNVGSDLESDADATEESP